MACNEMGDWICSQIDSRLIDGEPAVEPQPGLAARAIDDRRHLQRVPYARGDGRRGEVIEPGHVVPQRDGHIAVDLGRQDFIQSNVLEIQDFR